EAAGLHAVAHHRQVGAAEQLAHENREQPSHVEPVQPWPVDVEVAHHSYRQTELVVGEAEMLTHRLGGRIAPSVNGGGAQDTIVILFPGDLGIAPVNFGSRAED